MSSSETERLGPPLHQSLVHPPPVLGFARCGQTRRDLRHILHAQRSFAEIAHEPANAAGSACSSEPGP